ncbi:MAG: MFS transporter [Christensenellaceae bacterium]|nr:MFS transporter [Christensenellaceae bacterium]
MYQYTVLSISQLFLIDAALMGLLIGVQHFGMAVPPLILGVLCAKIGKKKVVLLAYLLLILGTALAGMMNEYVSFIVAVFVIGSGFAVLEATLSAVLADEFPGESTRHLNFSQVAFSIGALTGPAVAKALIQAGVYFKDLYYYCAVVFLVLGIGFLFTRHQHDRTDMQASSGKEHYKAFFKNRVVVFLALSIFLYVGIENTFANFTDSYFELMLGFPGLSATALSLFWGAMIPSRFLAGILRIDRKKMFVALTALICLSALLAMLIPETTVKVIMFTVCGFCCGPIWPMLMDTVAQKNAGASGPSMNIMATFSSLGGAVLPFAAGYAVNISNQTAAYYICAVIAVVMLWTFGMAVKNGRISAKAGGSIDSDKAES